MEVAGLTLLVTVQAIEVIPWRLQARVKDLEVAISCVVFV